MALCLLFPPTAGKASAAAAAAVVKLAALDRTIMLRTGGDGKTYGRNEVDPLIWSGSDYFTRGASRDRLRTALATVDAMSDAEIRRCSPAQRALVQNRVWTVLDHIVRRQQRPDDNRDLLRTLAKVMGKLALTDHDLGSIVDPLHEAMTGGKYPAEPAEEGGPTIFLPRDLGQVLTRERGGPTARNHLQTFGGRSSFVASVKMPADGPSPEVYFKSVAEFPLPWSMSDAQNLGLNRGVPALLAGTTVALVRRLAVVGRDGRWRVTPLTLSVQVRRYHVTDWPTVEKRRAARTDGTTGHLQSFAQFVLETEGIGAGGPGSLRPIEASEKRFEFLFAHDFDQVDESGDRHFPNFVPGPQHQPLQICAMCHGGVGLQSINTLTFAENSVPIARLIPTEPGRGAEFDAYWKESRVEWGALMALWPSGGP